MGIRFLWKKLGDATANDKDRTIDWKECYEVDSLVDYIKVFGNMNRTGRVTFIPGVGHFWIDASKITRHGESMPGGKIQFTCDYTLRLCKKDDIGKQNYPPWRYPPSEITFGQSTEETAVQVIYPPDSLVPIRFTNTAGVNLEASGTKGLLDFSFSYAVQNFDPNNCWAFAEKINAFPIRVCDFVIPERCCMIKSLSANEKIDYLDNNEIKWKYWEIKVNMLLHPDTWNKDYLNLGTHVWSQHGLEQLWHWTDEQGPHYEPYSKFLEWVDSGNSEERENRGEAVTEPMFLNKQGTGISGFQNYKAIPTYVSGSPYYPADFSFLNLPPTRNWR